MEVNLYKYFPYKRMNHREILLYGFHFSFFLIFTLAVTRDLLFGNYFNASVNFSSLFLTNLSYYLLHFKRKINIASNLIMGIAVIPLFILIYFNHFGNMVIVYVILLPIAAYFLLPFKKALFINFLIYLLLIGMLYYISIVNPDAPILNNVHALINIAFASMFIMFFGIFYHMAVDTSLSALIHSNRQKDILLKEVHHRVKNNLNVIASILGLQAMGKNDETREELTRSKSRIESIAIVHEMLYQQKNYEEIIFKDYVMKLNALVLSMYKVEKQIRVVVNDNLNLTLALNIMIQFGLIINEMLTNSLKYAKNENGLFIEISLEKIDTKYIFIYRDNGQKIIDIDNLTSKNTLGSKLIDLSLKQIDAKVKKYYNEGLCYEVRFEDA